MDADRGTLVSMLREWLRSERRLGVSHWAISPAAPRATVPATTPPATASHQRARPSTAPAPAAPPRNTAAAQSRPHPIPAYTPAAATPELFAHDPTLPPVCTHELPRAAAATALAQLDAGHVCGCKKCRLHAGRTQTVFGVGNPRPELVFVGEGPGADEDAQGEPFVGRAGQLLTRMIAAMTLTREQVYICNVVKCRPPENRTPSDDEMATCSPYLFRQLAILRPRIIVALGRPATQTLLVTKLAITKLRGQFYDFPPPALAHLGLPPAKLLPTYHPAYLLRNPASKSEAWEDLQQVMHFLGLKAPRRK